MDRTQAHRETALHAPQSGDGRFGGVTGTVALEQLPHLFSPRGRSSKSQRVGSSQDEDAASGRVRTGSQAADCPASHFSKTARSGAPPAISCQYSETTRVTTFHVEAATRRSNNSAGDSLVPAC